VSDRYDGKHQRTRCQRQKKRKGERNCRPPKHRGGNHWANLNAGKRKGKRQTKPYVIVTDRHHEKKSSFAFRQADQEGGEDSRSRAKAKKKSRRALPPRKRKKFHCRERKGEKGVGKMPTCAPQQKRDCPCDHPRQKKGKKYLKKKTTTTTPPSQEKKGGGRRRHTFHNNHGKGRQDLLEENDKDVVRTSKLRQAGEKEEREKQDPYSSTWRRGGGCGEKGNPLFEIGAGHPEKKGGAGGAPSRREGSGLLREEERRVGHLPSSS